MALEAVAILLITPPPRPRPLPTVAPSLRCKKALINLLIELSQGVNRTLPYVRTFSASDKRIVIIDTVKPEERTPKEQVILSIIISKEEVKNKLCWA